MITNEQIETLEHLARYATAHDHETAALRAAIDTAEKLPQFEDTKAGFVPSVDECWIVVGGDDDGPFVWQDWPRYTDKWEPLDDWARDFWTGHFYSTEAAAERAAKEAKP